MNLEELAKDLTNITVEYLRDLNGFDSVFDSLDDVTGGILRDGLKDLIAMRLEEEMK